MKQQAVCWVFVCVLAVFLTVSAQAELQNVQAGGQLHIRGYYWRNTFNPVSGVALTQPMIRWPGGFLPKRPIGDWVGGQTVTSYYDWDKRGSDYKFIQTRALLNVSADFTDGVSAFIELEALDIWGEDFRSNYVTGQDFRANSSDDVEMYQAYIEANDMFGHPMRLRIGRQEIVLGSGWLMGNNTSRPEFGGLSFDAIRKTWATDLFQVDTFYAKLMERGVVEQDGDIDLFGVYGSYTGIENIAIDAYWIFLRDARSVNDTNSLWFTEWLEDLFGLDDYDVTTVHTVGLRVGGTTAGFDFEAEAAYQFGDAGQAGSLFKPFLYGDDDAEYDSWAFTGEVGYTLDIVWQPRMYLGGAYFGGEDNRGISFWDWLNPFYRPEASVSFNRLFSDTSYSAFLDEMGQMSNFWTVRAGVSAGPTESVEVGLDVAYLETLHTFDQPVFFNLGGFKIPVAPAFSFWTTGTDAALGIETGLWIRYHYTEDLMFGAGWSHLFVKDGLSDGNYSDFNGLLFNGGTGDDDADYLYIETKLSF